MATPAQIAANRRNSQKSTGPRTVAGKAASSRNALTSGLYAKALVIHGEDPAVLDALRREYLDEFQPAGPAERDLLDTLVHTEWIRRRIRLVEAAAWNRYFARDLERCEKNDEPYDHIDALGDIFRAMPDRLDHIRRKLAGLDRLYRMTLADLQKLQSARAAATTGQSSEPSAPSRSRRQSEARPSGTVKKSGDAPGSCPKLLHRQREAGASPHFFTVPSASAWLKRMRPAGQSTNLSPQIGFVPQNPAPPDPPDTGAPHVTLEVALP